MGDAGIGSGPFLGATKIGSIGLRVDGFSVYVHRAGVFGIVVVLRSKCQHRCKLVRIVVVIRSPWAMSQKVADAICKGCRFGINTRNVSESRLRIHGKSYVFYTPCKKKHTRTNYPTFPDV